MSKDWEGGSVCMHFIMVCTAEPFPTLGLLPITVHQMINIFHLSMKFGQRSILDCASRLKSQTKGQCSSTVSMPKWPLVPSSTPRVILEDHIFICLPVSPPETDGRIWIQHRPSYVFEADLILISQNPKEGWSNIRMIFPTIILIRWRGTSHPPYPDDSWSRCWTPLLISSLLDDESRDNAGWAVSFSKQFFHAAFLYPCKGNHFRHQICTRCFLWACSSLSTRSFKEAQEEEGFELVRTQRASPNMWQKRMRKWREESHETPVWVESSVFERDRKTLYTNYLKNPLTLFIRGDQQEA